VKVVIAELLEPGESPRESFAPPRVRRADGIITLARRRDAERGAATATPQKTTVSRERRSTTETRGVALLPIAPVG
jgi:hypothetical protein